MTAEAMPLVCEFVLPFTSATTEEEALWISESCASEPDESEAPVSVRVPAAQISAAIEAPEVSERVLADQTEAGIEAIELESEASAVASEAVPCPSELEAFAIVVFTLATCVSV